MRVEREVQILSELGYRWATPILKHMEVRLALILQTNNTTQGKVIGQCMLQSNSHTFPTAIRAGVRRMISVLGSAVCNFRSLLPPGDKSSGGYVNLNVLTILHKKKWQRAHQEYQEGRVWTENVWSGLSELIPCPYTDICLNYTGKSQDTARTDGETSLPWGSVSSHTDAHTCGSAQIWEKMTLQWLQCQSHAALKVRALGRIRFKNHALRAGI